MLLASHSILMQGFWNFLELGTPLTLKYISWLINILSNIMFMLFVGALELFLFLNFSAIENINSKLKLFIVVLVLELLRVGLNTFY